MSARGGGAAAGVTVSVRGGGAAGAAGRWVRGQRCVVAEVVRDARCAWEVVRRPRQRGAGPRRDGEEEDEGRWRRLATDDGGGWGRCSAEDLDAPPMPRELGNGECRTPPPTQPLSRSRVNLAMGLGQKIFGLLGYGELRISGKKSRIVSDRFRVPTDTIATVFEFISEKNYPNPYPILKISEENPTEAIRIRKQVWNSETIRTTFIPTSKIK